MTRRIACYVVLVTLIWGAHTEYEEKVRDVFKSNMTKNDFSNLLQSLIKLNEQRVSVLQRLYRLEDYGVLSEVLRSGDQKTESGNPNNLYLIVMSKNENDPLRRKVGFQVVDSVTSLDTGNKIPPKLDFVLDPAGYITQNIRKENTLESLFANDPRIYRPKKIHRADDGTKKITTTTKTLKYNKPGQRTEVKTDRNVPRVKETSLKVNKDRKNHRENSRFEIVNDKGKRHKTSENQYPQTVGYISQSNEDPALDVTLENDRLSSKPIIINHKLSSHHKKSKHHKEGQQDGNNSDSLFNKIKNDRIRQYTKINSDMSNEKHHDQHNLKANKYTQKVQSKPQNDKLTTKQIHIKKQISTNNPNSQYPLRGKSEKDEEDYGSPLRIIKDDLNRQYANIDSTISIKKNHGNGQHKPKTNKNTPKVQSKQHNDKLTTKPIIKKQKFTYNPNPQYPLPGKDEHVEDDYGYLLRYIGHDSNRQYTINIGSAVSDKNYPGNDHMKSKTNKYTAKVNVSSKRLNDKLTTEPIVIKDISRNNQNSKYPLELQDEDYYGSPFSNIKNDHNMEYANINIDLPPKKLRDVNSQHILKSDKNIPKEKVQINQAPNLSHFMSNLNNQSIKHSITETRMGTSINKNGNRINGTVNKANKNKQRVKKSNINNDNTNANNNGLINTKLKNIDATKEIDDDSEFLTLAIENIAGSKPVIPETINDTQYEVYSGFKDHKDGMSYLNKDILKTGIDTPYASFPDVEHLKDNRGNFKKGKPEAADMPFANYDAFEIEKDVRVNPNADKLATAKDIMTFGNGPGFNQHKDVMDNLNKDKPNTIKKIRDNLNAEPKNINDYEGIQIYDDVKRSGEEISVIITSVGNRTAQENIQRHDPTLTLSAFDQTETKPVARKPFPKCLNRRALKLCCKSCISAYKNVCRKLKCTPRSKKALKSECKRSCKKIFASKSSKYSDDDSNSDKSDSDKSSDSDSDYS